MDEPQRRFLDRSALAAEAFGRLSDTALSGLWIVGSLAGLAAPTVGIVGTRVPSEDGRRRARELAADLGRAGVCVISGLALGVDAAAHEGALAAQAPTVGVLGGGHAHFFPRRNEELARRMVAAGGAVISPFPPGHPAFPSQFLARNGIVAALSDGLVVVEAAARSGALNTASWGADRGIPVMAFPGEVDRPKAAGCLALIRDGATLVRNAADVRAELGLADPPQRPDEPQLRLALDPLGRRLLAALAAGPADTDALLGAGDGPPAASLARLGELIAAGTVVEGSDGRFRRSGP